jgi:3-deoxy-7-phosphoheptulonate synthase
MNVPNYHYENLLQTIEMYEEAEFKNPFIVVDTNHDNSGKQFLEQVRIVEQTVFNRKYNEKIRKYVRGFMTESYLEDGRADIGHEKFGQSVTDPCLGWDKTKKMILSLYNEL